MGKDLNINSKIQNYIQDLSKKLHPVQIEIISYNESLGDIKRMQIAESQCHFLELITKISNAKKILEIGTFTGLSTLSMALGLPDNGSLITLDKLINQKFDMVFIDADKLNYKKYYEKSLGLIKQGGLIIIDNVLWHGEVADEKNNDKFTINIREFNKFVSKDKRVEQIIVPLGDGMTVCRVL